MTSPETQAINGNHSWDHVSRRWLQTLLSWLCCLLCPVIGRRSGRPEWKRGRVQMCWPVQNWHISATDRERFVESHQKCENAIGSRCTNHGCLRDSDWFMAIQKLIDCHARDRFPGLFMIRRENALTLTASFSNRTELISQQKFDRFVGTIRFVYFYFLANYMSSSVRLSVGCLSVVCLSVTFVHPTQVIEIVRNVSIPFGTQVKFHGDRPMGNPPSGELNTRGVAEYSDFGLIERYISETVQDRS